LRFLFSIGIFVVLVLALVTNWYTGLITALTLMLLFRILYKMGKGIVLLEVIAFLYVFTCLVMPLLGYRIYTFNNPLANLWVRYMPLSEEIFFAYTLPATVAFCAMLTMPVLKKNNPDQDIDIKIVINHLKIRLALFPKTGIKIMVIGAIVSLFVDFVPEALNYFVTLFFFGSFAGLLYVHFAQNFRYKKLLIVLFLIFILGSSLQTGMFTILAYMGVTIFSFFQIGNKVSMVKKILLLVTAAGFFIILQNVKIVYRKNTWFKEYEGSRVELFSSLVVDNVQKGKALLSENAFFPLYSRTNQGYNIALVMRKIPTMQEYDNGARLLTVLASVFIPRFLWKDKPEAGGKFNMKYYAGWTIRNWSTNVGPIGEAYGSFGPVGGVLYMMLLGIFLRWVYFRVFVLIKKTPALLCWLPFLFYQTTSSAETDTLQVLNSIIKSAFFIWLFTRLFPHWFLISNTTDDKQLPVAINS
jgi:hypothetical protein